MPSLIFDLALPAERFLAVYRGQANRVQVLSRDGRKVSLPAYHLRPFLTRGGIYGCFRLDFNASGELLELVRLSATGAPRPGGLQV